MNANDVLAGIQLAHPKYPLVKELVLTDHGRIRGDARKRRIDALLIGPGGVRTAIEVKVSKADFRRETEAKRRPWLACCHRFVYACPVGLILPDEVPLGVGLWYVDSEGVHTIKRCTVNKNPNPVPDQLFAALAYRLEDPRNRRRR